MLAFRSTSSSVKRKITDTFSRTVSGSLGTSSSGTLWKSLRGTWAVSSSVASVSDDASTYPINAVNFLENANVSANVSGGTGVMFWGTDANSWWASTVQYSTNSFSVNTCPGSPTSTCSGNGCTPSNCCSGVTQTSVTTTQGQNRIYCQNNSTFRATYYYLTYGSVGECNSETQWPFPNNYCGARNASLNDYTGCYGISNTTYTGTCSQTVTSSGTNYVSSVALLKSISGTVSTHESIQINTNTSALSTINSMKVTTSGNDISIQVFTTAGLLNKIGSTITRTITSPIKGIMVGLIKSPSSTNQDSVLSNFTAER